MCDTNRIVTQITDAHVGSKNFKKPNYLIYNFETALLLETTGNTAQMSNLCVNLSNVTAFRRSKKS